MFDTRFKKGVVFRIDADAADELNCSEGDDYAISKDSTLVEVRASRFKDGKPSRGRPRKFPTATVARLLGITDIVVPAPSPRGGVVGGDSDDSDDRGDSEEDEVRVSSLITGATRASSDETPW